MVSHLGNNAVDGASSAYTVHVGGGVNGGGVGDDAVSIPSGSSTIVIGGNFLSRGDVGEGIHLRCRARSGENERVRVMPLFIPSPVDEPRSSLAPENAFLAHFAVPGYRCEGWTFYIFL